MNYVADDCVAARVFASPRFDASVAAASRFVSMRFAPLLFLVCYHDLCVDCMICVSLCADLFCCVTIRGCCGVVCSVCHVLPGYAL